MKRLFKHRKRPYEEKKDFYDWDEFDFDEENVQEDAGEDGYFAQDAETCYVDEPENADTEVYYVDDADREADVYYADGDDADQVGDVYYADGNDADQGEDVYYADGNDPDQGEDVYYEDSEVEVLCYGEGYCDYREQSAHYAEANTDFGAADNELADYEQVDYESEESLYDDTEYDASNDVYYADYTIEDYTIEDYTTERYYAENYVTENCTAEDYTTEDYNAEDYNKDDYYAEDDDDLAAGWRYNKNKSRSKTKVKKTGFFQEMGIMDVAIACTGVLVLIVAVAVGGVYGSRRAKQEQIEGFVTVGSQLANITLPGETGLLAIADAQAAKKAAADALAQAAADKKAEEEKNKGYDEQEYTNVVTVSLDLSSILEDMKIKFVNKDTGKLISNVPFQVTVTGADGSEKTWQDDDMDGIIYKTEMKPGDYKVATEELTGDKYKGYLLPVSAGKVTVKEDIEYKKVDIANEIKTEDEVDENQEDTGKHETEVEDEVPDTVGWVDSTTVTVDYREVSKETILDPASLSASAQVVSMTGGNEAVAYLAQTTPSYTSGISESSKIMTIGDAFILEATSTDVKITSTIWTSSNPAVASVDSLGVVSAVGNGTAVISYTASGVSLQGGVAVTGLQGSCQITVQDSTPSGTPDGNQGQTPSGTPDGNQGQTPSGTPDGNQGQTPSGTPDGNQGQTPSGTPDGNQGQTPSGTPDGNQGQTPSGTTQPTVDPRQDTTTKLTDLHGNQIYVEENGSFREAVWADYYTAARFFVRSDAKYTGWQTIDGKVYYFDSDGNKVTGEQVIQGAKYIFGEDGSLDTSAGVRGIDVSKWNGTINWQAVKNSGIEYVIIRCGYRGSSKGVLVEDSMYQSNIKGALAAGLKVGVYFFSQAVSEAEAVEEASMVLEQIKNYNISYPVFLDVEPSGGRADDIDVATRTAVCEAFCQTIRSGGYTPGIYANKTWLTQKLYAAALSSYKIWLAQYAQVPDYSGKFDMWQYQATGRISGINGDVDMNWSYIAH